MPIKLTPFSTDPLVHGYSWDVQDEEKLAELIARVALGQAWTVEKILLNAGITTSRPSKESTRKAAVDLLTKSATAPAHRDGWMFQVMSWMAARKATPDAVIRPPQMIHADKGFDGLQLDIDTSSGEVLAAIIFEDKATENPRDVIREEVWPDFQNYENGKHDNVLISELSTLLATRRDDLDPETTISNVLWNGKRHYRVSITISKNHSSEHGRKRLFKGYESVVNGDIKKRRGETIMIEDLRNWLDRIANKAIAAVPNVR